MPKAYSYSRFSTKEQEKGDSLRRQVDKAKEYAASNGYELDDSLTFEDKGISAFKGANATRGALKKFLDAIELGMVEPGSVLLVENLDRMSRQDPWDALPVFQQIINSGVSIVTVQDGRVWSREELRANPIRIMESLFVMIRANEESATKSRRLKAVNQSKREKAKRGEQKVFTRRLPGWLRVNEDTETIELIPERAKVVAEIFELANEGMGKEAIAKRLNERKEPTFGKAEYWRKSYVDKILRNPAAIGTFISKTRDVEEGKVKRTPQETIDNYFPAVVDKSLFMTIEALRSTRASKGRYAAQGGNSLFAGLTTCALCGSSFVRVNKGFQTYLVCSKAKDGGGCKYLAQPYEKLEAGLREAIPSILKEIPRGGDTKDFEDKIEWLREELSELGDEARYLVDDYAKAKSPTIRMKIDELEQKAEAIQEEIKNLAHKRESQSPAIIKRRIENLKEATSTEPWVPSVVNRALRENIKQLKIDPPNATVDVQWQTGEWAQQGFRFETRHFVSGFDIIPDGFVYRGG